MKRLDKDEIDNLTMRLSEWQTPEAMHSLVNTTVSSLGLANLFNQGGLAFLRDAWIAAEFGSTRNAEKVRLVSDNWPDFELLIDSKMEAYEAVEADDPDRRRGLEYRQGIGEVEADPVEDWIARAEQAPDWLETVCRKKASKRYGARANLVIYLNLSEYGIRQAEVEACFLSATEVVKGAFEAVWVLWKKRAYRVWPWTAEQAAIPEMHFPSSRLLPSLLSPDGWTWNPPSGHLRFWIGEDADGTRWLVKFRGGFCAVRERAFSIIAQALGISCQSSTLLKVPRDCPAFRSANTSEVYQSATLFLDEHEPGQSCDNCPLSELNTQLQGRPYDLDVLRASPVAHAIDMARGQMLGMLCEMHEPPGCLFTRDHEFVQIDNEFMFSRSAGADLWDSPWVTEEGRIIQSGLEEAVHLCEQVLSLPDEVFQEALQLPPGYRPKMKWNVRQEIDAIRPRARKFLETARLPA